ncbi:transglutaminase-like domain-containing protein [Desulforhopalus singaporensis]|uniref:Transglutaminase-like superfamily protein n=1 Tax=Desulforhopalus singaporensis TaxID=91360 RepID=A0A1H0NZ42_9BACT|nr:transglutaminase family protein [Desulforhopalus singaporensis]SDO98057.1 Transglutaminase-like superfamily protein [Desulforhopalus singaporensis]
MYDNNHPYLQPSFFIDSDHPDIIEFADTLCSDCHTPVQRAITLYYAVRDRILYDPYDLGYSRDSMRASAILKKGKGYCVAKAVLLAALGRRQKIPCRLGFGDVTNHLTTPKLRALMGTDIFIYHGYTEMLLDRKWVKATPAFNLSLCERFGVKPLEFDGQADSIFHEFDTRGRKHMEYLRDRGTFVDVPFDEIFSAYRKTYPGFAENFATALNHSAVDNFL